MSNLLANIVAHITDTFVAGPIGKDENTAFEVRQRHSERVVIERGSRQPGCVSAIAAQSQRFRAVCIANGRTNLLAYEIRLDSLTRAERSARLAQSAFHFASALLVQCIALHQECLRSRKEP
jgi:hypothetical protein